MKFFSKFTKSTIITIKYVKNLTTDGHYNVLNVDVKNMTTVQDLYDLITPVRGNIYLHVVDDNHKNIYVNEYDNIKVLLDKSIYVIVWDQRMMSLIKNESIKSGATLNNVDVPFNPILDCDGLQIKFIKNPTLHMCERAVEQNPLAIEFCKLQSSKMIKRALIFDGKLIRFIINKTLENQLFAIRNSIDAFQYVTQNNITCQLQLKLYPKFDFTKVKIRSDVVCKTAIHSNPWNISYIKNPSHELRLLAVSLNGLTISCFKNHTNEICTTAVIQNGLALPLCKIQNYNIMCNAVQQNGLSIRYTIYINSELLHFAVNQNGCAIEYIHDPSIELCKEAISNTRNAFKYIKHPSKEIINFYTTFDDAIDF